MEFRRVLFLSDAASLLSNVRPVKAAYLTIIPKAYRHDAWELWVALAHVLTRYLGGLTVVLAIQGALSAVALYLIGVPYALALGAWVSITAVIPFLGAWLGAVPALLVAFSISPTAMVLTARSEEHTSELQSLMRISYAVFCLKKKKKHKKR